MEQNNKNTCLCGKIYKTRSGLWKHKNKCTFNPDEKDVPKVLQEEESSIDKLNKAVLEFIETHKTNLKIIEELLERDNAHVKLIQDLSYKVERLEEEKEQAETTLTSTINVARSLLDIYILPNQDNKCN